MTIQDDPKISKREGFEKAYKPRITQSLLMSDQMKKINEIKEKYEIELGIRLSK